jgi:hypothetical protein
MTKWLSRDNTTCDHVNCALITALVQLILQKHYSGATTRLRTVGPPPSPKPKPNPQKSSNKKDPMVRTKGAFPPSHFSNKLADKLAYNVTSQTNVTYFCLVCQSEVCCKPNWFATNSLRQRCEQVCHEVCCKNVMVETHLSPVVKSVA